MDVSGSDPHVSLCMIVRDEQDFLADCLDSVKDLVDEIVIVDTGSTDRTIDIAKGYGAEVYHHEWEEDYSKHRNQSISYARGEWILIMDADEVIAAQDIGRIRHAIDSIAADGFMFTLRNYEKESNLANLTMNPGDYAEGNGYPGFIACDLIRLFRKDPDIFFSGKVHETVTESFQKSKRVIHNTGIPIHHYGKVRTDRVGWKREAYLRLGEDEIRENPDTPMVYKGLSDQYLELGRPDKALEVVEKGLAVFPDMPQLRFNRGLALDRSNRPDEAIKEYLWVLERRQDHLGAGHNLGRIYFNEGRFEETIEVLNRGINTGLRHPAVFVLLGRAYDAVGLWQEAVESFNRAAEIQADYPDVNCYKAVVFLNRGMYDAALSALEREIGIKGNVVGAYNLLGQMSFNLRDLKSASRFFENVLTIKPDDPTAQAYLDRIRHDERPYLPPQ